MVKITAINGSLRKNSANGLLLEVLKEIFSDIRFDFFDNLGLLPHFNPDLSVPQIVFDFKKSLHSSDYILIVTPEYAHGIPGVLKNALDWLVSDEALPNKDIVLFVCSAGDGQHAMSSLVEITRTMSLNVKVERCFNISGIRSKFEGDKLIDQETKGLLVALRKSLLLNADLLSPKIS